jgi:hypothetical protein
MSPEEIAAGDYSVIVPVRQKKTNTERAIEQASLEAFE